MRFPRNTRGLIRRLKETLEALERADSRAQVQADKHGKIPLLFNSTADIAAGMTKVKARADAALLQ